MLFELIHTITVLVFAAIGWALGHPVLAAWFAVMYFVGREIAQAEYKWIEYYGGGFRKNMPWWGAVDHRVWDVHSFWWNLTAPILVAAIITVAL